MYMSECVIGGGSQTLDIVSLSIRVSARNHYEPKRVILIASNRFKADFFVFLRASKICFTITRNHGANTIVILIHFSCVNSLMGVIFSPSCRPPSNLIMSEGKRVKKVASNQLKIGQQVAYG